MKGRINRAHRKRGEMILKEKAEVKQGVKRKGVVLTFILQEQLGGEE